MTTPEFNERQKRYMHIAKSLESASKEYENAALGLQQGISEEHIHRHVKNGNAEVESAFPELFAPPKQSAPPKLAPTARDYTNLKVLLIALLVLGLLYSFVAFGPTGDLTKTWMLQDLQKNVAYPK
jgi:hypothetical protein